jgi:hypothetical protein
MHEESAQRIFRISYYVFSVSDLKKIRTAALAVSSSRVGYLLYSIGERELVTERAVRVIIYRRQRPAGSTTYYPSAMGGR